MISVLIPFRAETPERQKIFDWIRKRYELLLPEAELCIGDSSTEVFNRSEARNNAFEQASGEFFLVADADTIFHPKWIYEAISVVEREKTWVLPYEWYYNLSEEYTQQILELGPFTSLPEPEEHQWEFRIESWAGLLVMTRQAYETVRPYDDPTFTEWSYEDNCAQLALDTLWGPHKRLGGHCLHLWHPVGTRFEAPHIPVYRARYAQYLHAVGNPDEMKALKGL